MRFSISIKIINRFVYGLQSGLIESCEVQFQTRHFNFNLKLSFTK